MKQIYQCPICRSVVNYGTRFCINCGTTLNWPIQQELQIPKQNDDGAKCPYCSSKVFPIPNRNKKCPSCGNLIFIRQHVLMREEDAKRIDKQKNETLRNEIAVNNYNALESYKRSGVVSRVEILTTMDSCPICKAISGVYLISDVPLLPVNNCTHKQGCRCCYLPVVD